MVIEFHANLGAVVDIASRSSGIVFRIVTLRVAESAKRSVQVCQSFSKNAHRCAGAVATAITTTPTSVHVSKWHAQNNFM